MFNIRSKWIHDLLLVKSTSQLVSAGMEVQSIFIPSLKRSFDIDNKIVNDDSTDNPKLGILMFFCQ